MADHAATSADQLASDLKKKITLEKCIENYVLIDTGCYMCHKKYERDLDAVVQRANDAGVTKMITICMTVKAASEALRLCNLYPDVIYCTVGIHPHEAKTWNKESYQSLLKLAENPECVAIGECGLDFNRLFSTKEEQIIAFEEQIKLSIATGKPIFVHERNAFDDVYALLAKYKDDLHGGVIHCFTGTMEQGKAYLELGFFIGLTGYILKDRSSDGVVALIEQGVLTKERMLVESNSPYMFLNAAGPHAKMKDAMTRLSMNYLDRHCSYQRNEPCSLPALVEVIAKMAGCEAEDVATNSAFNSIKLFGLIESK